MKKPNMGKSNVIFRRFKKLPNGKLLDAWDYGYKAWPIRIKEKNSFDLQLT